jgi:hypothetical protein
MRRNRHGATTPTAARLRLRRQDAKGDDAGHNSKGHKDSDEKGSTAHGKTPLRPDMSQTVCVSTPLDSLIDQIVNESRARFFYDRAIIVDNDCD